jgi:hypothetical protein
MPYSLILSFDIQEKKSSTKKLLILFSLKA